MFSEKPILFQGWKVERILEWDWSAGNMQTRRVIKMRDGSLCQDEDVANGGKERYVMDFSKTYPHWMPLECRYGMAGDRLWVRESWQGLTLDGRWWHEVKREDRPLLNWAWTNPVAPSFPAAPPRWMPSIHMPKMACRIWLEVVDVRVGRAREIEVQDIVAEGLIRNEKRSLIDQWVEVWDGINEKRGFGWDVNPWVWVVEFKAATHV